MTKYYVAGIKETDQKYDSTPEMEALVGTFITIIDSRENSWLKDDHGNYWDIKDLRKNPPILGDLYE